jgi:D-hydroxyproline dehydrogenase subunit alpha
MKSTDLAVIGAGPGGLAAAISAAQAGLQVTLLDENQHPGGQYLRGQHREQSSKFRSHSEIKGRELISQLPSLDIKIQNGCLVWGIKGHRLALYNPQRTGYLDAKTIIIAAGARELVPPFPGWTLPGVMTLGAAQIMVKDHGLFPRERILIAGSGPLLLAAAVTLMSAIPDQLWEQYLLGIVEATQPLTWLPHAGAMLGNFDRLQEGWAYLNKMRQAKIPYRFGRTVIQAHGTNHLTHLTTAQLDKFGLPIPGSQETIPADTLCLGYGFIPNIELTQLAGCSHSYQFQKGGWVPDTSRSMQTCLPGIYAVGECAGIGGAGAAMIEGQIAGISAAHEQGHLSKKNVESQIASLQKKLAPHTRFSAMLNTLFGAHPNFQAILDDHTIICRCEEVNYKDIREGIENGASDLSELKNWVHAGQGNCQGRTCGPIISRWMPHLPSQAGQFRPRPPLKPIPFSALAQGEDA